MNIESLITDLAIILLLGAVVTVVFKWLRQPVVLGYIVAGFLASPNFTYLPSVANAANIDFWAQIGIVVLLFSLGLEFSFKKLVNSGGSAVVTALIIVSGMMGAGFVIGHALHFNYINSLFLGGMLSMSSTTIILKAFTDMGLKQQKFASLVLAVLIVEDLFAVLMMVILSSIAINNSVEGSELLLSIGKLLFFLIIWFLVGVLVLPTTLGRIRRYLNAETLLVVSMGLCLGMAVFSVYCGFSLALGAFVMGSILAGTSYAERIEHVVTPIKDLFGAVFFISVGMLVQPAILTQYWLTILVLSLVVIVGMIIFGTAGMLLTGQPLNVAIRSGFSLTQIGEFSFIIATLGMSLGVLDPSLYPIVVAVSVITTFLTPYSIKLSTPAASIIEAKLPRRIRWVITRYHRQANRAQAGGNPWSAVICKYLWRTTVYSIIIIAVLIVSRHFVRPYLAEVAPDWGNLLTVGVTIAAMLPFLIMLVAPLPRSAEPRLPDGSPASNVPRIVFIVFRSLLGIGFVVTAIGNVYSTRAALITTAVVAVVCGVLLSRRMMRRMSIVETRFIDNLNERELRRSGKKNQVVSDLHQAYMTVGAGCPFVGDRLMNSNLRAKYGVNIISIRRGERHIAIPGGQNRLFPGDVIGVIGTDEQLSALLPVIEREPDIQYSDTTDSTGLTSVMLGADSPLIGKTPQSADLRNTYHALVVAVSRGDEFIDSNPGLIFEPADIVWLVGNPDEIDKLK